jgi:hypothetical protein
MEQFLIFLQLFSSITFRLVSLDKYMSEDADTFFITVSVYGGLLGFNGV